MKKILSLALLVGLSLGCKSPSQSPSTAQEMPQQAGHKVDTATYNRLKAQLEKIYRVVFHDAEYVELLSLEVDTAYNNALNDVFIPLFIQQYMGADKLTPKILKDFASDLKEAVDVCHRLSQGQSVSPDERKKTFYTMLAHKMIRQTLDKLTDEPIGWQVHSRTKYSTPSEGKGVSDVVMVFWQDETKEPHSYDASWLEAYRSSWAVVEAAILSQKDLDSLLETQHEDLRSAIHLFDE